MSNETTLDDVLALVAKATPGPWEIDGACCADHDTETRAIYHRDNSGPCPRVMEVVEAGCGCHFQPMGESDAALIVAAVNYLRAHGDELRAALEDARRYRWIVGYGGSNDTAEDDEAWDTMTNGGPKERIDAAIDAAQEVV